MKTHKALLFLPFLVAFAGGFFLSLKDAFKKEKKEVVILGFEEANRKPSVSEDSFPEDHLLEIRQVVGFFVDDFYEHEKKISHINSSRIPLKLLSVWFIRDLDSNFQIMNKTDEQIDVVGPIPGKAAFCHILHSSKGVEEEEWFNRILDSMIKAFNFNSEEPHMQYIKDNSPSKSSSSYKVAVWICSSHDDTYSIDRVGSLASNLELAEFAKKVQNLTHCETNENCSH